jgi:hypothetical protein
VVQVARYDNLLPAQKLGDEPNVMESHCDWRSEKLRKSL